MYFVPLIAAELVPLPRNGVVWGIGIDCTLGFAGAPSSCVAIVDVRGEIVIEVEVDKGTRNA